MEPGKYQQLEVGERLPVRRFVEGQGLEFSPGRAFYQLTKKETVQDYKLVLARRKADGALVAGEELRTVLNIPKKSAVAVGSAAVRNQRNGIIGPVYRVVVLP